MEAPVILTVSQRLLHLITALIHYACPALSFVYFLGALTFTICTLQTQSLRIQDQQVRRKLMVGLTLGLGGTYLAEVANVIIGRLAGGVAAQDRVVYLVFSAVTFGTEFLVLTDTQFPVWYPYYGTWFIALAAEITLFIIALVDRLPSPDFFFGYLTGIIRILRVCLLVALPVLYFALRNDQKKYDTSDAERQVLLGKKLASRGTGSEETLLSSNDYGTSTQDSDTTEDSGDTDEEDSWLAEQRKAKEMVAKRLKQDGNWFTYAKGFMIFIPYVWPHHDKMLQLRAALVGVTLLASNIFGVLVPASMGLMIDHLANYLSARPGDPIPNIWLPVVFYATVLFVSGNACIGWIQKWLWLPVEQYAYDALSTASHAHLMNLSSDFHDNKTSSDLGQAISGGRSVADLLETVLFQVLPMFIDLAIAAGYLSYVFGPYMGLLLSIEAIVYLYTTTKLIASRAEARRLYVTLFRKEWTVGQQSLDGWNTASLFNQIPYEERRYGASVKDHLKSKRVYELSSHSISAAQGAVMTIGLLGALFLGVFQVAYEDKSIGNLTTLIAYWVQLQSPLIFFSNMYRTISYSLMDSEKLLDLFQTKPTITDAPNAKPLDLGKGQVEFNRVSFAYDERKPTLKEVSFIIPPGKTVALVGETGGGKSTILKLIDRFYDVKSGSITIDEQDIRDVTLSSLREKIGVVPQDPMLFNDTIMNNIRYARLSATDEEVHEACRAAAIHDKILTFPDQYHSRVGDRGVKLSGGEKQRVAVARAFLKKPDIILLDEATSAVDTETEGLIQEGLQGLCSGRTTFIVAHRLSTVMKADKIMVVMNGEIIEQGSHFDLIHAKGKYHDLWSKQVLVQPTKDRAPSKSPKKRDSDLINDITPTQVMTTLLAAPSGGSTTASGATSPTRSVGGGYKREGSKLKPDAPAFVPQISAGTPKGSEEPEEANGGPALAANQADGVGDIKVTKTKSTPLVSSVHNLQNDRKPDALKHKRFKQRSFTNQKKQMSKSESSQSRDSTDEAQGSDTTVVHPVAGPQKRHISNLSVSTNDKEFSKAGGSKKRRRNHRFKTRENSRKTSSAQQSSMEEVVLAPPPTPVDGPF